MISSKLTRVPREAFVRLLVALAMAGIAVGVLGGSRWVVARDPVPVYFVADLYGTVALLWLAAAGHRVGRRIDGTAHAAFFGTTSGTILFHYGGYPRTLWTFLVFVATLLPAIPSPRSARPVAFASLVGVISYTVATWRRYETNLAAGGLPWAVFGAAPFFVYAAILSSRGVNERSQWPKKLTVALVVLATLELIGIPTSFLLMLEFGLRHTWFRN